MRNASVAAPLVLEAPRDVGRAGTASLPPPWIRSVQGRQAVELHVTGVVQGVGFRPFVHRLAMRHGLEGWVRNESGEVRIHVEGAPPQLTGFVAELRSEAPPLARIDRLDVTRTTPGTSRGFSIAGSTSSRDARLPVSPDVAMCGACEQELFDPSDRRHRYAFVTCTDCGPRYTVIESMPYDRERTSMSAFPQCPECLKEYWTPAHRRYHSETNSCAECGPRVWALDGGLRRHDDAEAAIAAATGRLVSGGIVAIRGLGGFHLAVDATSDEAVRRLRARKRREAKPLAIMVRNVEEARAIGHVGPLEERLLRSPERPIVLLARRPESPVAPSVAPGLGEVGVMTAYTPLHHLLLEVVGRPLVMTSGNLSDEPIAICNDEAVARLAGVADAFLLHDREIVSRYDDSVVRIIDGAPAFLRRARGYAPLPLDLPHPTPAPLLAVGPHLKNTFTLAEGRSAYVSQHIGDLESLETLEHFQATLRRFRTLFHVDPRIVVRDLHPGYLSTRVADDLGLERTIVVQHHHAHVAAVAAEHGVREPVVGLAFDGTGYGDDGRIWGAELLTADLTGYRRMGRLRYAPLPGGDLAARLPWRAALGYLSTEPDAAPAFEMAFEGVGDRERATAEVQVRRGLNAPPASSMGRLFDAAAAVLGIRRISRYEGQAAMELEAAAGDSPGETLPFPVEMGTDGTWVMDPLPLLAALGDRRREGGEIPHLAASFHRTVARTSAILARSAAESFGIDAVALGGGVFQNARLTTELRRRLEDFGLRVLVARSLSPNDGAISYGQAAVAAATLTSEAGG